MNNNLNCDNVCDLLELYHDELVRPSTAEAVSNHLSECETCRKEYEKIIGTLPDITETSTRNEFAKLMKKKKTKQIVTTVICCLLACLILASTNWALTEAKLKVLDINEVHQVYKYTDPTGKDYLFVLFSYDYDSAYREKKEVTEDAFGYKTVNFNRMVDIKPYRKNFGPYADIEIFEAEHCDELIFCGKTVWTKETDTTSEVPGYVEAFYDFTFSRNYNEDFDEYSDALRINFSINPDNVYGAESYFLANYPDKIIKWNLKGEVIEEVMKNEVTE